MTKYFLVALLTVGFTNSLFAGPCKAQSDSSMVKRKAHNVCLSKWDKSISINQAIPTDICTATLVSYIQSIKDARTCFTNAKTK